MIVLSDAAKNASCDAICALANGGSIEFLDGATLLVVFTLQTTAFEDAGTSVVGAARAIGGDGTNPVSISNPLVATATDAGSFDTYQVKSSGGSVLWSGSATADFQFNGDIADGQKARIIDWTFTTDGDIIPAERLTLWDPGLNAVGGIPTYTTVFASMTTSDSYADIQDALDDAHTAWLGTGGTVGQVVLLAAGTYDISGTQGFTVLSGVVLRGAGFDATFLTKVSDGATYPVAIIGKRWPKYSAGSLLTIDGVKDEYTVTLASTTVGGHAIVAGDLIVINQEPDPDFVDWGTHVGPPGDPSRGWFNERDRPLGQICEVVSVVGSVVTVNTPLHHSFSTAFAAHVCMFGDGTGGDPDLGNNGGDANLEQTQYAGIEDLCVEYGDGDDGGGNLHMFASKYCWIKNVESRYSTGHSVNLDGCFRCEVRDSFIHSTVDPNPGGAGYGTGCNGYASDCLFENNIIWNFNKVTVCRASGGGNVWGYNYMDDMYGSSYRDIVEIGCGPNHYACSHHELFEGNRAPNYDTESFWGNSIYGTAFRNHFTALRRNDSHLPDPLLDAHNRRAVGVQTSCWWHSFVGNVLGLSGQTPLSGTDLHANSYDQIGFTYQADIHNVDVDGPVPMWKLGYDGTEHPTEADPSVLATTYRHGNFDYVTNDIVWDSTVSNQNIPDSLYLSSKPDFMGSKAWPWVVAENPSDPLADTLPAHDRFVAWSEA